MTPELHLAGLVLLRRNECPARPGRAWLAVCSARSLAALIAVVRRRYAGDGVVAGAEVGGVARVADHECASSGHARPPVVHRHLGSRSRLLTGTATNTVTVQGHLVANADGTFHIFEYVTQNIREDWTDGTYLTTQIVGPQDFNVNATGTATFSGTQQGPGTLYSPTGQILAYVTINTQFHGTFVNGVPTSLTSQLWPKAKTQKTCKSRLRVAACAPVSQAQSGHRAGDCQLATPVAPSCRTPPFGRHPPC
jgi:hypothetical protein